MDMEEKSEKPYIGYEYKEIRTDSSMLSLYLDGYQNFGWQPDGQPAESQGLKKNGGKMLLRLKRDRKIINKAELTRLQRNFEDCMKQIEVLEKSKTSQANGVAMGIGMAGTIFMAGSTFAVTAEPPVIWLCILLAIPGFAGWILPYFCFRAVRMRRCRIVAPLIEDRYDEIYEICRKGNKLMI